MENAKSADFSCGVKAISASRGKVAELRFSEYFRKKTDAWPGVGTSTFVSRDLILRSIEN
jgi:hypothetical protein